VAIQSWADRQLADLRETYEGCWDIWYVARGPRQGYNWHARPVGTPIATVHANSPDELADKLGTLMCQCPVHASKTQTADG
jgi:hypothetical protein